MFLFALCILIPIGVVVILPYIFNNGWLKKLQNYYLTAFNFLYFTGLLGLLIFHFRKGTFVLILLGVGLLSLVLYRYLTKIIILQFLLAAMSLFSLIPRLFFVFTYDDSWKQISENIDAVRFKEHPNIYLIQPDGYANFSELRKPPYNHLDTGFEDWLIEEGFVNYRNFRSNYFNTLSSNSSTFAMKHHYFQNIHKGSSKTYGMVKVIAGNNNALRILKNNNYKTHLFTDNLFFLINRKLAGYDFCNIPQSKISFHKISRLQEINIVSDFEKTIKAQGSDPNFYFIEKTIPGHIRNSKWASRGIEKEREVYLEGVELADAWLMSLIKVINEHDKNPLIIIMADHGGYVGLEYTGERDERKLNETEISSMYSVLLSIKWPGDVEPQNIDLKTNVNLFRSIFYDLSKNPLLLKSYQTDNSFIYTMENNFVEVYQCLDENGVFGYKKID